VVDTLRVLALDPGVTTGWAYYDAEVEALRRLPLVGQERDQIDACDLIASYLDNDKRPLSAVICESYRITQQTLKVTRQSASLEIIGVARWLSAGAHVDFVLQSPGDAKRFMTDAKLKSLGWWRSSSQDHAHDALRHLGLYLAKQGSEEILRAGL
jgi:hypothetical protein